MIWGSLWNALFISTIFPMITLGDNEKKAFNLFERTESRSALERKCAHVITKCLKILIKLKKKKENPSSYRALQLGVLETLRDAKILRKQLDESVSAAFFFEDDILSKFEFILENNQKLMKKEMEIERVYNQILDFSLMNEFKNIIYEDESNSNSNSARSSPMRQRILETLMQFESPIQKEIRSPRISKPTSERNSIEKPFILMPMNMSSANLDSFHQEEEESIVEVSERDEESEEDESNVRRGQTSMVRELVEKSFKKTTQVIERKHEDASLKNVIPPPSLVTDQFTLYNREFELKKTQSPVNDQGTTNTALNLKRISPQITIPPQTHTPDHIKQISSPQSSQLKPVDQILNPLLHSQTSEIPTKTWTPYPDQSNYYNSHPNTAQSTPKPSLPKKYPNTHFCEDLEDVLDNSADYGVPNNSRGKQPPARDVTKNEPSFVSLVDASQSVIHNHKHEIPSSEIKHVDNNPKSQPLYATPVFAEPVEEIAQIIISKYKRKPRRDYLLSKIPVIKSQVGEDEKRLLSNLELGEDFDKAYFNLKQRK